MGSLFTNEPIQLTGNRGMFHEPALGRLPLQDQFQASSSSVKSLASLNTLSIAYKSSKLV